MSEYTQQEVIDIVDAMHENDRQNIRDLFGSMALDDIRKADNICLLQNMIKHIDLLTNKFVDCSSFFGGDTTDPSTAEMYIDGTNDVYLNDGKSLVLKDKESYSVLISSLQNKLSDLREIIAFLSEPVPPKDGNIYMVHKEVLSRAPE